MATTSSKLVASKAAVAGQGGNGQPKGRRTAGVVATAALGLALVAGTLFSHGRQAAQQVAPQASVNPVAIDTHVASMWDFREDHRVSVADSFVADTWTYREDRRPVAATAFVADQFTYREDRRDDTVLPTSTIFVADRFTYREDRRGEALTSTFIPDIFTYREDHRTPTTTP